MGYTTEIIKEFKGTINGVEFDNKEIFYSVAFILDQLEEEDLQYNNFIIYQLQMGVDYLLRKDYLTISDIQEEMATVIGSEKCFPYDFVTNPFEDANEELRKLNPLTIDDVLRKYEMTMREFAYEVLVEYTNVSPITVLSREWGLSDTEVELVMNEFKDIITSML